MENERDPWEPLIEEAKERNVSEYEEIKQNFTERGLDEESASSQAYLLILPKLQKALKIFVWNVYFGGDSRGKIVYIEK